jgi:hypothetical protein
MLTTTRLPRALVALVVAALMAGCSSDGSKSTGETGSGSDSGSTSPSAPAPSNYLDVGKKITLTPAGTALKIGEKASAAWQLDAKRIAVVDLKVTKVEQVPIAKLGAWVLDKGSRTSTPYYVHASVKNIGRSDLSQLPVPLYIALDEKRLVSPSSFESTFKPCPSVPLPKKFKPGKQVKACWVYLAPKGDKLKTVSFFTGPGFVPVTWAGKVTVVKDKPKKKDKKKGKSKS